MKYSGPRVGFPCPTTIHMKDFLYLFPDHIHILLSVLMNDLCILLLKNAKRNVSDGLARVICSNQTLSFICDTVVSQKQVFLCHNSIVRDKY